ncbi:hypothetical protein [Parasphingopyxis marina]|uniref:Uncharacterized protein n=1 Tax=Parasphingopyxis marina TaxID=2761622 RepID=A0A842I120_9SPHN|nr:hypothetical protein [Parasphingopyxis marina]MBC2777464.1 hypothetical protein [Parasphingopyxis marina]
MTVIDLEQGILLGLALLIGLLIGLILSPSGKWKRRYRDEHARYVELERDHEARIRAANERIAEIERHDADPIGARTGAAIAGATKGSDDLTVIRGLGRDDEITLNEMGFHRYKQIAKLSAEQRAAIEGRLGAEPGMVEREAWSAQAALLHRGELDEHSRQYRAAR